MAKKVKRKEGKTETVAEFLARGGEIEKLQVGATAKEPKKIEPDLKKTGKTKYGPPNLMSLSEGQFWFGDKKKTRKKKKKVADLSKVDFSVISSDLLEQLGLNGEQAESTGQTTTDTTETVETSTEESDATTV